MELCPIPECTMPTDDGSCEAHDYPRVIFRQEFVPEGRDVRVVLTQWEDGSYRRTEIPL